MLIVGAGGFAKDVFRIFDQKDQLDQLKFYDDLNDTLVKIFDRFPVLKNEDEAKNHFSQHGNEFTLGIGNPMARFKMCKKFEELGGALTSCFSPFSKIGRYNVAIGNGANVLDDAIVSNDVVIGKACLIYFQVMITHNCLINDFVELSPGATLLGHCKIGSFTQIGANATILPGIRIGENVIVGAGSVVTKDVGDNCVVAGVPAKIVRTH